MYKHYYESFYDSVFDEANIYRLLIGRMSKPVYLPYFGQLSSSHLKVSLEKKADNPNE